MTERTERTPTGTEVHLPPPPASTTHVTIVAPHPSFEGRMEEGKPEERPAAGVEEPKEGIREHERKEFLEREHKIAMKEEPGLQPTITVKLPPPVLKIEFAEPIVHYTPPKETSIKLPPTTIVLETAPPKVEMEQRQHEVRITPPAPVINVAAPHPIVNTEPIQEVHIQPPAPVINVSTAQPVVRMEQVSHEVSITPPAPVIKVYRPTPIVDVEHAKGEGRPSAEQQ